MFGMMEALIGVIQRKSGIKSVQRGISAGAGDVVINAVTTTKVIVISVSKGSAGYVAARGQGTVSFDLYYGSQIPANYTDYATRTSTFTLSGGTTDLTVKSFSAKLVNATKISCDGACEWQVIEFV